MNLNTTGKGNISMEKIKRYFFMMDVGDTRRLGVPTMINKNTGWFRIMDGARTSYVIKRHFKKHHVTIVEGERI